MMLARTVAPVPALILSFLMLLHLPATTSTAIAEAAVSGDGIVKVKSVHGFDADDRTAEEGHRRQGHHVLHGG